MSERQSIAALLEQHDLPHQYAMEMESKGALWVSDLSFITNEDQLTRICPSSKNMDMHVLKLMSAIRSQSAAQAFAAGVKVQVSNRAKFDDSVVTADDYPGICAMGFVLPPLFIILAIYKQGMIPLDRSEMLLVMNCIWGAAVAALNCLYLGPDDGRKLGALMGKFFPQHVRQAGFKGFHTKNVDFFQNVRAGNIKGLLVPSASDITAFNDLLGAHNFLVSKSQGINDVENIGLALATELELSTILALQGATDTVEKKNMKSMITMISSTQQTGEYGKMVGHGDALSLIGRLRAAMGLQPAQAPAVVAIPLPQAAVPAPPPPAKQSFMNEFLKPRSAPAADKQAKDDDLDEAAAAATKKAEEELQAKGQAEKKKKTNKETPQHTAKKTKQPTQKDQPVQKKRMRFVDTSSDEEAEEEPQKPPSPQQQQPKKDASKPKAKKTKAAAVADPEEFGALDAKAVKATTAGKTGLGPLVYTRLFKEGCRTTNASASELEPPSQACKDRVAMISEWGYGDGDDKCLVVVGSALGKSVTLPERNKLYWLKEVGSANGFKYFVADFSPCWAKLVCPCDHNLPKKEAYVYKDGGLIEMKE